MDNKGITLIELVLVILVGGIFLPLTYVVFTSVVNSSMKPETAGMARGIAETKINDIKSLPYDSMVSSFTYSNVTDDTRFQRTSPNPFDGYQWKWQIDYIAYKDESNSPACTDSHCKTTANVTFMWQPNTFYKIGDYVTPTKYLTDIVYHNFYRVYYPLWNADRRYELGDMVRPATSNDYYYKSVEPGPWQPGHNYGVGEIVRPTTSNNHYYKCVKPSSWQANANYTVGALVKPTTENGYYYKAVTVVGSSTSTEPSWSTSGCFWERDFWNFDFIKWCPSATMTSDSAQPTWPTAIPSLVTDNYVVWQENTTLRSGSAAPTWKTGTEKTYDGGVTWEAHYKDNLKSHGSLEPSWQTVTSVGVWQANTTYALGTRVRPNFASNRFYSCTQAGTSGSAQPTSWPTIDAGTVADGTVIWQEKSNITDNNVSWTLSSVYKRIMVYVKPAGCGDDSCAHVFTVFATTRDYLTRP